jgi:hypothetical protein
MLWSLLITGFILWFVIRIIVAIFDFQHRSRRFFDQFTANNAHQDTTGERKGGWSRSAHIKRKRIDGSVGEYVDFEEVDNTAHPTSTTSAEHDPDTYDNDPDTEPAPRVSDAEWEDIR